LGVIDVLRTLQSGVPENVAAVLQPLLMVSKLFFRGNGKIIKPRGIALIFADTAESLTQVPQTPSPFHPHPQYNAFRRPG